MIIRSLATISGMAGLLGLLLAAQYPPSALSDGLICPFIALTCLAFATLRSEGNRHPAMCVTPSANP